MSALIYGCSGPRSTSALPPSDPNPDPAPVARWSVLAATNAGIQISDQPDTLVSLVHASTGESASVGCSASFKAFAVRGDDRLVVGDGGPAGRFVSYRFAGEHAVLVTDADGSSVLFAVDGHQIQTLRAGVVVLAAKRP